MKIHEVRCWPRFFGAVLDGSKKFEIRKKDRDYQIGDRLIIREYNYVKRKYTGREVKTTITYVLGKFLDSLSEEYCVLSIESDPWYKVEDFLPSPKIPVLITDADGLVILSYLEDGGEWITHGNLGPKVTHWQPLPPPPAPVKDS